MHRPRLLLAAALLAFAPGFAVAQQLDRQQDLQQQMSPAEFKAAGLDKLSNDELAQLNAWLQGKVQGETQAVREQAREEGRQEVITRNRGFFDFGSRDPIVSTLVGRFDGFAKGRHYVLANGQEWEQTEAANLSGVHLDAPEISIRPGLMGVWYMKVSRYNTQAKVRRIK